MDKEILEKGVEAIAKRLAQDNRRLLYLVVSGSHAWGLEKPDSDIDLRGVYQDSTMKVLGLHKGRDTVEFSDGIYDVQLYEVGKFFNMLCKHNGNMVNLISYPHPLVSSFGIAWVGLAKAFTTKKLRYYYRGYADGQRKRAMSERGGKALIYTYREMFSGLYTMRYGYMEYDFTKLWDEAVNQGWYDGDLLTKYFPDPTQEVTDEGWHRFYSEWDSLCIALDREADLSKLPDDYDGVAQCTQLLQQLRLQNLYNLVVK